ncbi:putative membrane protein [Synechococcus sp. BIOS-E4-1]|nr:putative membrane protein [Synechococcus sp. BIOS-E4-1]
MSPAIDGDVQHGLSDTLLFSFLSTALSSAAVCFVLIMWFDLLP